jgi:GIY-YIG catalytic domain-containing protein
MTKIPVIQGDIVAHLRGLGRPETSTALASRFLRIVHADEETCRRLLAPFLATVPGVVHRPGEGWSLLPGAPVGPAAATGRGAREDVPVPDGHRLLRDFVACASEGTGPAGSGRVARVCLLPVVAGEECQEEIFPDETLEDDTAPAASRTAGPLTSAVLEDILQTIGDLPLVCHRVAREVEPLRRLCAEAGLPFQAPVISASRLGHLLLGLKASHQTLDLAQALGVSTLGPDDCRGRARIVAASFLRMASILEERGIDSIGALLEYQDMPAPPLDFSGYTFTAEDLKGLPAGPGVYRFLDRDGQVIYVGKAKNLKVRVGTYFTPSARGTAKGRSILDQVHSLQFEPVLSELEASLLEAALISEHRPALNRQFDVHERPAPYGPRLNLVVVLKDDARSDAPGTACTFHFLRGGHYLGRIGGVEPSAPPAQPSWSQTRDLVARSYFTGGPRDAAGEGVDIDWRLVASFVRKNRDEVNVLDIDECASPADAEKRLRVLAAAALGNRGRTVAR